MTDKTIEEATKRAAEKSTLIQQVEMFIWEYCEQDEYKRNAITTATKIIDLVSAQAKQDGAEEALRWFEELDDEDYLDAVDEGKDLVSMWRERNK